MRSKLTYYTCIRDRPLQHHRYYNIYGNTTHMYDGSSVWVYLERQADDNQIAIEHVAVHPLCFQTWLMFILQLQLGNIAHKQLHFIIAYIPWKLLNYGIARVRRHRSLLAIDSHPAVAMYGAFL